MVRDIDKYSAEETCRYAFDILVNSNMSKTSEAMADFDLANEKSVTENRQHYPEAMLGLIICDILNCSSDEIAGHILNMDCVSDVLYHI